ncbi:T9SS type A sorting domain-containing protein [Pollutibacter soli]|uniref:T9SS type A sorting domain-containing protein n=1 Tax=Pollutibacter soli TaxID=3034157 RepID=UPI0030135221
MGAYFFYRKLLITVACLLPGILAFSQKVGDYRSAADGNWNDLTSWQIFTDSGWFTPTIEDGAPGVNSSNIQIRANNKITITTAALADQIRIEPKAILFVADTASLEIANGVGTDLIVEGTFDAAGTLITKGTISLQAYSLYRHRNKSTISTTALSWHPLAAIEVAAGGAVEWQLNLSTVTLCRLSVLDNTSLNFTADKNAESISSKESADTSFFISSGSSVNISGIKKFTIGSNSNFIINGILKSSGEFDISELNAKLILNGKLANAGSIINSNALNFVVNDNAVYEHLQDGGSLPVAKWSPKSNCIFTGIKTKLPSGLNQVLGNVSFNSDFPADIVLNQTIDCQGNLLFENSSKGALIINTDSTHHSLLVGGNFNFTAGTIVMVNSKGAASLQVTKNFIQSGGNLMLKKSSGDAQVFTMGDFIRENGTLFFNSNDSVSGKGKSEVVVLKSFVQNGGTTNFSQNDGIGNLYVDRNFSFAGGVITETGTGYGNIYFAGDSVQIYDAVEKFQNTINVYVDSLSFLQMASENSRITSNGKFVLRKGGTLGIRSISGLMPSPSLMGHIFTPVRNYTSGANIVFNGSSPQATGTAYVEFIPGSITIDNPTKVTQSSDLKIAGDLNIVQGELYSRNKNINLEGNWVNNGFYNFGNYSTVSFTGYDAQLITGKSSNSFYGLVIKNAKDVSLGSDISVASQLELLEGNLVVGSHILSMGVSAKIYADSFSSSKMLVLNENGEIRKYATNFLDASYFFPIGNYEHNKKYYSPISITFSRGGVFKGYASVSVTNKKHPASPDNQNYLERFWTVQQNGYSKFTATVSTTFDSSDVSGSLEALRMGKFSHDTLATGWVSFPDPAKANTFTTTQITSFSDFTGIGLKKPDPKDSIKSNARFAVADNNAFNTETELRLFPNPVSKGPLQLSLLNFKDGQYEVVITNTQGQKVVQQKHNSRGSITYMSLNLNNNLPSGVYYLTVTGTEKTWFTSFIKQ